jgi:hypothetical protein
MAWTAVCYGISGLPAIAKTALIKVNTAFKGGAMMAKPEQFHRFTKGYVSEFDQFLARFLRQHPDVEASQRKGWYLCWDHKIDFDALAREARDHVPVKPYHYE